MHTILICDDDRDIVSALDIYLASEGYRTLKAYNGLEAIQAVERNEVHLILMDIMMPELDGIRATARLREGSNIPIILLTAKSEDADKILGLNIGADDYITKPFNPLEVIARVKSQLLRMQLKVDTEQMPTLVNLLNSNFTGISADEMNRRLMDVSEQVTPQMFLLLSQTIAYAADVLQEAGQKEVFTVGTSQLLKLPEFRDADKAHQLMSFLSDSKENLPVPDEGPMKILIGPENVSEALQDTSVVVASYDIGNDMRGLIGVVGPTRMDYGTVAARLSGFAEGLTRLFGKQELPPKEDAKE